MRRLLGMAGAGAALLAASFPADAEPLRDVRLLLDGHARPGSWTALEAKIQPESVFVVGSVRVHVGPALFEKRVSVPAGASQTVLVPVYCPTKLPIPRVTLAASGIEGGTEIADLSNFQQVPELREVAPEDLLVGVEAAPAARAGLSLPEREVLPAGGAAVRWVSVSLADLREAPEILDGLDGLVYEKPEGERAQTYRSLDPHLGVWLGRGGRVHADVAAARKEIEAGWKPRDRRAEGADPLFGDLFPRAAWSRGRVAQGWMGLGVALAFGAAAVGLLGWRGLPRRGPGVVLALGAAAGSAGVAALVPGTVWVGHGVAVREIYPVGGSGGRVAEAIEGFVALESQGPIDTFVAFPPGTRVSAAEGAAPGAPDVRDPVEIVGEEKGWTVRLTLPRGGRRIFRFSQVGPAGGGLRVRFVREEGKSLRLAFDNSLDLELTHVAVVAGGAVYAVGTVPEQPFVMEDPPQKPDWEAFVLGAWPVGDPGRALRLWWGRGRVDGSWVAGTAGAGGGVPVALGGRWGGDVEWTPVLVAVRVGE